MADIRYVCLSDLHLGEEDSLLTKLGPGGTGVDLLNPSPVLQTLVACLDDLISHHNKGKKPTLILNGDILELALCNTNHAAMVFERFIEQTMCPGSELFDEIIYLPGNHDHHLWEIARETQYVHYINRKIKPGEEIEPPWHHTHLFPENQKGAVQSYFLTNLIQRYSHLADKEIKVFYPNLGIRSTDGGKCIVFTHGHFTESIYHLMSTLKGILFPRQKRQLTMGETEAENFAWIDFFWSSLGRSGQVGQDVEAVYEKLQYVNGLSGIVEDLADSLSEQFDLPGWGDWMESKFLKAALGKLMRRFSNSERGNEKHILSFEAEEGLEAFVAGPLHAQLMAETGGRIPDEMTLVFGHTHKPFQKDMRFTGYPQWVNVYNTGGWVVEGICPTPAHGGAVVLVDSDLNTTALRMYNESENSEDYRISAAEALHGAEKSNPLYTAVKEIVDSEKEPWCSFPKTAAEEVKQRTENLYRRVKARGYIDG